MDTTSLPPSTFKTWLPPIIENLTPFTSNSLVFALSRLSGTQLSIDLSKEIQSIINSDKYVDVSVLSVVNELQDKDLGVAILPLEYAKKLYTRIVATDLSCLEYLSQIPTMSKIYYYAYDFAECLVVMQQNKNIFEGVEILVREREQLDVIRRINPKQEVILVNDWKEFIHG